MIGIMCPEGRVEKYLGAFAKAAPSCSESFLFFALSGVDLKSRTVNGTRIIDDSPIRSVQPLPLTIVNLAVQYSRQAIRELRQLTEIPSTTVVNHANRFNQWMLMEMLSSSEKPPSSQNMIVPQEAAGKQLPFTALRKGQLHFDSEKQSNWLLLPEKGCNRRLVIYIRQLYAFFEVYHRREKQHYHLDEVAKALTEKMSRKRWVLLQCPELVLHNEKVKTVRIHLHKCRDWQVLSTHHTAVHNYAVEIVNCIGNYLPSLEHVYLDFVVTEIGTFHFARMGGWDRRLLRKKHVPELRTLCENLVSLHQGVM